MEHTKIFRIRLIDHPAKSTQYITRIVVQSGAKLGWDEWCGRPGQQGLRGRRTNI